MEAYMRQKRSWVAGGTGEYRATPPCTRSMKFSADLPSEAIRTSLQKQGARPPKIMLVILSHEGKSKYV